MANENRKEVIIFNKVIQPKEKVPFSERIKADGTVEGIFVKFNPGQQKALHIYPYVKKKGEQMAPMVTFPMETDQFLSGDNYDIEWPTVMPVENDEEIVIIAENTDETYPYTMFVAVVIDYFGGKNRVIGGMI